MFNLIWRLDQRQKNDQHRGFVCDHIPYFARTEGMNRRKKDGPVLSNPLGELAVRNAKYVKNCTELYMADRQIEVVANFEKFVNLEVLWLNNNHLQRIDGLDANFRIKKLYVHGNRIRDLSGSLSKFTFLEEFHAHNNEISNLRACLAALSHMHHIKTLNLFNNPVAEEDNYRLQVVAALPSLEVLDKHAVTPSDRAAAARFSPGRHGSRQPAKNAGAHGSAAGPLGPKEVTFGGGGAGGQQESWPLSGCTKLLMRDVRATLRRKEAEEEDALARMYEEAETMRLAATAGAGVGGVVAPLPKAIDFKTQQEKMGPNELREWEKCRLRHLFEEHDVDGGGVLSRAELRKVLRDLEDYSGASPSLPPLPPFCRPCRTCPGLQTR